MHQRLSNGICYGISTEAVYVTPENLSRDYLRRHPMPDSEALGRAGRALALEQVREVRLYDNPHRTVRVVSGDGKLEINLRSEEKQIGFASAIMEAVGVRFRVLTRPGPLLSVILKCLIPGTPLHKKARSMPRFAPTIVYRKSG